MPTIFSDPEGWGIGVAEQTAVWTSLTLCFSALTFLLWWAGRSLGVPFLEAGFVAVLVFSSLVWPLFLLRALSAVVRRRLLVPRT